MQGICHAVALLPFVRTSVDLWIVADVAESFRSSATVSCFKCADYLPVADVALYFFHDLQEILFFLQAYLAVRHAVGSLLAGVQGVLMITYNIVRTRACI